MGYNPTERETRGGLKENGQNNDSGSKNSENQNSEVPFPVDTLKTITLARNGLLGQLSSSGSS